MIKNTMNCITSLHVFSDDSEGKKPKTNSKMQEDLCEIQ